MAVSPKNAYFARLDAACAAHNCDGRILIQGVGRDEDEEEEEEEEEEEAGEREYTAAEIAPLRHVLVTPARVAAINAARDFVSCGEDGWFNTHTGNTIIAGIPRQTQKAVKKATRAETFDALFGLTFALYEADSWMNDNEEYEPGGGCEKAVKGLAKAWKALLSESDSTLGIDSAFTRPGTVALLTKFADSLSQVERGDEDGYPFVFQ